MINIKCRARSVVVGHDVYVDPALRVAGIPVRRPVELAGLINIKCRARSVVVCSHVDVGTPGRIRQEPVRRPAELIGLIVVEINTGAIVIVFDRCIEPAGSIVFIAQRRPIEGPQLVEVLRPCRVIIIHAGLRRSPPRGVEVIRVARPRLTAGIGEPSLGTLKTLRGQIKCRRR